MSWLFQNVVFPTWHIMFSYFKYLIIMIFWFSCLWTYLMFESFGGLVVDSTLALVQAMFLVWWLVGGVGRFDYYGCVCADILSRSIFFNFVIIFAINMNIICCNCIIISWLIHNTVLFDCFDIACRALSNQWFNNISLAGTFTRHFTIPVYIILIANTRYIYLRKVCYQLLSYILSWWMQW